MAKKTMKVNRTGNDGLNIHADYEVGGLSFDLKANWKGLPAALRETLAAKCEAKAREVNAAPELTVEIFEGIGPFINDLSREIAAGIKG